MLSFGVIIWCYYSFNVFIWCYHFSQFANVIIFVLSFFLVQHGCYHLCYHLMLLFFVIISPFFLFPENVTHSVIRLVGNTTEKIYVDKIRHRMRYTVFKLNISNLKAPKMCCYSECSAHTWHYIELTLVANMVRMNLPGMKVFKTLHRIH